MFAYQLIGLIAVAQTVGEEVNNPEGGLHPDSSNDTILETIVDIANGSPHFLRIDIDRITVTQRARLLGTFAAAAGL